MGFAALLFGILVGFFHFQQAPEQQEEMLAAEPEPPALYADAAQLDQGVGGGGPGTDVRFKALADAESVAQMAQLVADIVADQPAQAGKVLTIALAQVYDDATLGDVATLAAAATKAAPGEAASLAGVVARSLGKQSEPALAAAVATIVALVPEQTRDIGLVVGAVIGDDATALGMVAQTVAISTGEETFSSLSEGSGVSIAALMKQSTALGSRVPHDIPAYAAQMAPQPSQVAESESSGSTAEDAPL